jgi:hypothetical protein
MTGKLTSGGGGGGTTKNLGAKKTKILNFKTNQNKFYQIKH